MKRLMTVEARRLLRTRSTWGIVAAMVGVVVFGALQTAIASDEGKALWERQGYFLATLNAQLFLLVLGAKAVTDDFRYGTILPAVLVTPRRSTIVGAKLATLAVGGIVAAGIAGTGLLAVSWSHLGNGLQAVEVRSLAGFMLAGALWTTLGGAIGYLVRHQVGAIVGVIAWTLVVGQMFQGQFGRWAKVLPSDAGEALAIASTAQTMLTGGLILMAYAVGAGLLGAIVMQRRDVL